MPVAKGATRKALKIQSQSIKEDYILGPLIGTGAFAEVRKCELRATMQTRAVKILQKHGLENWQTDSKFILGEVRALNSLDHPNILRVFDIYQDSRCYYVVMEYCEGGELFDRLAKKGTLREAQAAKIMFQLLSAVAYCHERMVIHRDIKPENILLMDNGSDLDIKVADFGCSSFLDVNRKLSGVFGSVYYIAPEVLKNCYNEKCDVWSCGVIMYILLTGRPPYNGKSDKEIQRAIVAGSSLNLDSKFFGSISESAKDLITQLLTYKPTNRISAKDALSHDWITQFSSGQAGEAIDNVLSTIRTFNSSVKLKDAIHCFIAKEMIASKETKEMKNAFLAMDINKDGTLCREELLQAYSAKLGDPEEAEAEVDKIMAQVDSDGSGVIDYTEFLAASIDQTKLLSKQNLRQTFALFDKDGSGAISAEELRTIFGYDEEASTQWTEIIEEVDQNGDGEIDIKEFENVLLTKY